MRVRVRTAITPPSTERAVTSTEWLELLGSGEIEILGRMPWSSNATFLVLVSTPQHEDRAIYKPGRGERPLRDFPDRIYRREVAAYELSVALGLDVVPETIVREHAPLDEGSLQRFIDADYDEHYFTMLEDPRYDDALRTIAAFDLLLNNADRKGGHLLKDGDDHLWGIDNGLSFHVYPKLRTVMWDFAGEVVPEVVRAGCERLCDEVPAAVAELIDRDECSALRRRAAELADSGRFPFPDPSLRQHPWPLV